MKKLLLAAAVLLIVPLNLVSAIPSSPQESKDAQAYYKDGLEYSKQGKYKEAIEAYRLSIQLKNSCPCVFVNLSYVHLQLEQFDEAARAAREAISLNPQQFVAHSNLGYALIRLGRLDEAVESLQLSIALNPDYYLSHNNLGYAYLLMGRDLFAIEPLSNPLV